MSLTIGFSYSLKDPALRAATGLEDEDAEFEDPETIDAITQALERLDARVVPLPYRREVIDDLRVHAFDIVFNIAEGIGTRNREAYIPALLEMLGIPYTGSDPLTLGLTHDKALCKTVVQTAGIHTPPFDLVTSPEDLDRIALTYPLFVKPNHEGSSKGIRAHSKVRNRTELYERVVWALERYRQPVLVEEFIEGPEFSVGVLGNRPMAALPVVELAFGDGGGEDRFYAFERKRLHQKELLHPPRIPGRLAEELQRMAVTACRAVGCRDYARADFRVDRKGRAYFLEINALPGLSPAYSIYTFQAEAAGMTHAQMIHRILSLALARYDAKCELSKRPSPCRRMPPTICRP